MSLPPKYNYLQATKKNNVYVETGCYIGDSLKLAMDAGFDKIIGLEIDANLALHCSKRFKGTNVRVYNANSAVDLIGLIRSIDEPITFFLDAHWQMLEGVDPGKDPFPLLDELRQIAEHHLNPQHEIIIDDWYIFFDDLIASGNPKEVYNRDDVKTQLEKMGYKTHKLIANPIVNGILHASI